jgi:hypothetical protein
MSVPRSRSRLVTDEVDEAHQLPAPPAGIGDPGWPRDDQRHAVGELERMPLHPWKRHAMVGRDDDERVLEPAALPEGSHELAHLAVESLDLGRKSLGERAELRRERALVVGGLLELPGIAAREQPGPAGRALRRRHVRGVEDDALCGQGIDLRCGRPAAAVAAEVARSIVGDDEQNVRPRRRRRQDGRAVPGSEAGERHTRGQQAVHTTLHSCRAPTEVTWGEAYRAGRVGDRRAVGRGRVIEPRPAGSNGRASGPPAFGVSRRGRPG